MVNYKGDKDLTEESDGVLVEAGTLEDDDDWIEVAGTKELPFRGKASQVDHDWTYPMHIWC